MDRIALLRDATALLASAGVADDLPDQLDRLDQLDAEAVAAVETDLVTAFDAARDAGTLAVMRAIGDEGGLLEQTRARAEALAAAPPPPAGRRAALSAVTAPAGREPTDRTDDTPRLTITASGRQLDRQDLPGAFLHAWRDLAYRRPAGSERHTVARLSLQLPEERRLADDPVENRRRIEAVVSPEALTAAGGLCAPVNIDYRQQVESVSDRPVRDALAGFQADRGGVQFVPPPVLSDVTDGVVLWTEANDQDPSDPATKPVHTASCESVTTVNVSAIPYRLQVGNFSARTFPEQVDALLSLLQAQQARTAEQQLLDNMTTASTAVTASQVVGAARDLLTILDRAAAAMRSRHRMAPTVMLRAILPAWARDMMRADITLQLAGDDTLAVADQRIAQWFASRHIAPTWALDADPFGAQSAGALLGWPATVDVLLYPEGSFLFLDGGELNLGMIRDATLNATNDVEWFAETFENVAFLGVESLAITATVCPDGSAAGTVDTSSLCAS